MRHDYELPPEWEAMTDVEKSNWMTRERNRRQAMQQQTATSVRAEKSAEREARKISANPGTVPVKR